MVDIYQKTARALFDRFVVNSSAVAVQNENGKYITVKTPLTVEMIRTMLLGGFSLGTYQQQSYNDKLKWICFDFDTDKKTDNEEDLYELKKNYVIPFLNRLKEKGIIYTVEFSGRRGFHVWVFFNQIITKDLAYSITSNLIGETYLYIRQSGKFGLDLFPKTYSGKVPNKYGLQVKLPLSCHKASGTYSYIVKDIENFSFDRKYELNIDFLQEQYDLITAIEENEINNVLNNCGMESKIQKEQVVDYHKQFSSLSRNINIADVKDAFCTDAALGLVWNHIMSGTIDSLERMLLVGIFGHMNYGEEILNEFFKLQNNYNRSVTQKMISKYKKIMYPVTFKYLYQYLHLDGCPQNMENVYLDDYVIGCMGIEAEKFIINNEEKDIAFVKSIVDKEINYFYYNDEVFDFEILNQMKMMSHYDYANIENYIENVEVGKQKLPENIEFRKYIRKEETKDRILISLGAKERIITTALINKMILYCQKDYKSYSYHLNLGAEGDVFYPWVSSWTRFKNDISQYFSVPFFADYVCVKVDFKQFYDNVFLHSAFDRIVKKENILEKKRFENIYHFLVAFNEKLMLASSDTIRGVPQGPAYARVLAELTIDELIDQFMEEHPLFSQIRIYRYVDDMFVFAENESIIDDFLNEFSAFFEKRTLFFNKRKTKNYGRIKDLLPQDRDELQEFRDFNYDIFQLRDTSWSDDFGKEMFDSKYLRFIYRRQNWDINDANLILSDRVDESVKRKYISQFYNNILLCEIGRGSLFRKFYTYLFENDERLLAFFNENEYKKVPSETINQNNMIVSMILNAERIKLLISKEQIQTLFGFINELSGTNVRILKRILHEGEMD